VAGQSGGLRLLYIFANLEQVGVLLYSSFVAYLARYSPLPGLRFLLHILSLVFSMMMREALWLTVEFAIIASAVFVVLCIWKSLRRRWARQLCHEPQPRHRFRPYGAIYLGRQHPAAQCAFNRRLINRFAKRKRRWDARISVLLNSAWLRKPRFTCAKRQIVSMERRMRQMVRAARFEEIQAARYHPAGAVAARSISCRGHLILGWQRRYGRMWQPLRDSALDHEIVHVVQDAGESAIARESWGNVSWLQFFEYEVRAYLFGSPLALAVGGLLIVACVAPVVWILCWFYR
jgi:hypothetical protein